MPASVISMTSCAMQLVDDSPSAYGSRLAMGIKRVPRCAHALIIFQNFACRRTSLAGHPVGIRCRSITVDLVEVGHVSVFIESIDSPMEWLWSGTARNQEHCPGNQDAPHDADYPPTIVCTNHLVTLGIRIVIQPDGLLTRKRGRREGHCPSRRLSDRIASVPPSDFGSWSFAAAIAFLLAGPRPRRNPERQTR